MIEDGLITQSSTEQIALERRICSLYSGFVDNSVEQYEQQLILKREQHITYIHGGLQRLPAGFVVLDSSRPWICYWIVHSLALLHAPLPPAVSPEAVIDFLAQCQDPDGGFGGGPLQLPHLAPTYAAVATLVTLGGSSALNVIDKAATFRFLLSSAIPPEDGGGFAVCEGGEIDVRGAYTALATAHMLKLDKVKLAEQAGVVQYVCSCQTYEGGLGGEPGNEAHGGYTFCGLAALMLIGKAHKLDLPRLVHWAVHMQGEVEGGFMGRTNKLVDGCYSFWQGGVFPLLRMLLPEYLAQTHIANMPITTLASYSGHENTSSGKPAASRAHVRGSSGQDAAHEAASSSHAPASSEHESASSGNGAASSGSSGQEAAAASAGMTSGDVMKLEGQDPVVRALNDLHRTKVKAEAAAEAATAAEAALAASQASESADIDNVAELYQAARRLRQDADGLQEAVQHALQYTDDIEATAALLCSADEAQVEPVLEEACDRDDTEQAQLPLLYNVKALQLWLLQCCQAPKGGMRDKPGKPPDYYHTCYCLSGLSSLQHFGGCVLGPASNRLVKADALCNVVQHKLDAALDHAPQPPDYL